MIAENADEEESLPTEHIPQENIENTLLDEYIIDEFGFLNVEEDDFQFEENGYALIQPTNILSLDYDEAHNENSTIKPLCIACSGGGGHITAMKALFRLFKKEQLTIYSAANPKDQKLSLMGLSIFMASYGSYSSTFTNTVRQAGLPVVPTQEKLAKATKQLMSDEPCFYIDMLLHVYRTGHLNAAIWNVWQREGEKEELLKLVQWQEQNDKLFYSDVSKYFLQLLLRAHQSGTPYTEIISTQALGLAALCDVVRKYNQIIGSNIVIHQYMTDLPRGSIHFLGSLSKLKPHQQAQMKLYAVGINEEILRTYFKEGWYFKNIYDVNPQSNPMVRYGFRNPLNDNSNKLDVMVTLTLRDQSTIDIPPHTKISAIMLGSQASTDTHRYIKTHLALGMKKIFVFGGTNPEIKEAIETRFNAFIDKIILLDTQEDDFMASLMSRCQILVISRGGLTIMEQKAMNHPKNQIILIHYPDANPGCQLTSGIPWEDANADDLIADLKSKQIRVLKTSPNLAYQQLYLILIGCGLLKINARPSQKLLSSLDKAYYILTATEFYYYNTCTLSPLEVNEFELNDLQCLFKNKPDMPYLSEAQLIEITDIIGNAPHLETPLEEISTEPEWNIVRKIS